MKKITFFIGIVLTIALVACDNSTSATSTPQVSNLMILGSGTTGLIERSTFTEGEQITVRFTVTDENLDVTQAVLIQQSEMLSIDPIYIDMPRQQHRTQIYTITAIAEIPGNWAIEIYVINGRGNRSNTVSLTITVTELVAPPPTIHTITFNPFWRSLEPTVIEVQGGSLIPKPDNPILLGSDFVRWYFTNRFGTRFDWNFSENTVNDDITFFSEWNYVSEVSNIIEVRNANGALVSLQWDNPIDDNFSHVLVLSETGSIIFDTRHNPNNEGHLAAWQLAGLANISNFIQLVCVPHSGTRSAGIIHYWGN